MKNNVWTKAFWREGNYQFENGSLKIKSQILDNDSVIIFSKNVKRTYRGYEATNDNGESFFCGGHQVKPVESVNGNEYAIRFWREFYKGDFERLKDVARIQEIERKDVWYK